MRLAKTIAVSDDVYEVLSKIKLPEESFSDVIRKSLRKGARLSDIAGSKTITREEWSTVARSFRKQRALDEERKKRLVR
ncbi:MAG: antitoxin VapB family protein, partial [Hadesarchaea archaeon]|nr:antitoxin VapB family protein [Hadesarchaea archaeon]